MLSFDYAMELDFAGGAAAEHAFTLRCLPQENALQHAEEVKITVEPAVPLSFGRDSFGNRYCWGLIHEGHTRFCAHVTGRAERFPEQRERAGESAGMLYRQYTDKTRPGPCLSKMLKAAGNLQKDTLGRAIVLRDYVHSFMTYVPGATDPATSAEEAAGKKKGVCQDYAHILLALCRMCGIPCRYACGMLLGEGASHAWVEILQGGEWVELDPTNPGAGGGERLVFSYGRDADDCEINRGVYRGPASQKQKVMAVLERREYREGQYD